MDYPAEVVIREVGPRDGLQNELPVPTEGKLRLINALSLTGLAEIEAVSFVRPGAIPQMADAEEVWTGVEPRGDVVFSALVLNVRGAERAVACGARAIQFALSASETHNLENVGRTVAESVEELTKVVAIAGDAGAAVSGTVSTVWGCPFEGDLDPSHVAEVIERVVATGVSGISLGDTTGMATPVRVSRRVADFAERYGSDITLNVHLHDTRGAGLANVLAALDAGCSYFDAAVGGLGGCPYAPGATGNICTEDLVHMLEDMGIRTSVSLDRLLDAARIAQALVDRELPSHLVKAGPRLAAVGIQIGNQKETR